jgi:tetratricopeptide (TPR) repeat protein
VQLDSTHVPSLLRRAWLAVTLEDADAVRRQLHRLAAADTANPVVRTAIGALRAVLATDAEYDATLDSLTSAPFPDWLTLYRFLRLQSPRRAELLLHRLRRTASPGSPAEGAYLGEWARMLLAEGRLAEVDSGIVAGAYNAGELYKHLNRFLVAASLAGVGDERATRRALAWLEAYVPPDSASAYFETRPVWWTGWLIGAYHASLGDTAVARRWQRVIGTFPAGGTPQDYRAGLRADIEARLAVRRGAMDRAVEEAQRAVQQWSIHTGNDWEALAAPAMRFHLAMALRATGHPDSAAALLRSLVPPTTWMGFLTARASYELGRLSEESGDLDAAARHYATALNLWERGDAAVAEWRDLAREGLRRVMAVRG